MKKILIVAFVFTISLYAEYEKKIVAVCKNAKSQTVYLETGKASKFEKDKMQLVLYMDAKGRTFVDRLDMKISPSELSLLSARGNVIQFAEPILDGYVIYTLHSSKGILTIQRSYEMIGLGTKSVMANIYLKCK